MPPPKPRREPIRPAINETKKTSIDKGEFIKKYFTIIREVRHMLKDFLMIIWTIFLLEFADKTQIAAISFATRQKPIFVYFAVIIGLSLATVISVAIGRTLAIAITAKYIKILAGILFIGVGIWTILGK
jgi:putative Ca2+/H+ antiporter (TMEM165/GDT1 family)